MSFLQLQSLPAKKIRRDLEQELIQQLLDERNNLFSDMSTRGLLGANSIGETGVYRISRKFGLEVLKRSSNYFLEHRSPTNDRTEYESFMHDVIEYIYSVIIVPEFSRPPFNGWNHSLNTIKLEFERWIQTEAEVQFPIYSSAESSDILSNCTINYNNLDFMNSPTLHKIVKRDLNELKAALNANSIKSVLVLSGSILEGILLDILLTKRSEAEPHHPKSLPLEKWQLSEIIDIAGKLSILPTEAIAKFSHGVREFRNLIHPGRELKDNLVIAAEEARIVIEVVNIVLRTLSKTE
ncbi:MAG: hypothetical protein H6Q72_1412 [Firmicutes bacterium]|nr:hypothetical protein [Bacillota bacterium]